MPHHFPQVRQWCTRVGKLLPGPEETLFLILLWLLFHGRLQ